MLFTKKFNLIYTKPSTYLKRALEKSISMPGILNTKYKYAGRISEKGFILWPKVVTAGSRPDFIAEGDFLEENGMTRVSVSIKAEAIIVYSIVIWECFHLIALIRSVLKGTSTWKIALILMLVVLLLYLILFFVRTNKIKSDLSNIFNNL